MLRPSEPLAALGPAGHIGIVVEDLDTAISTFSHVVGRFRKLPNDPAGVPIQTAEGTSVVDLRAAYSIAGPPFIELIQGVPGTLWDRRDGPYVHHIGYWVPPDEMEKTSARLTELGLPWLAKRPHEPGQVPRILYHASGDLRIELIDARRREELRIGSPDP